MGNCWACFTDKDNNNSRRHSGTQCKYQPPGLPVGNYISSRRDGGGAADIDDGRIKSQEAVLLTNNNYPMTAYPQQQQHHRLLHNRNDALETQLAETEGLLHQTTSDEQTKSSSGGGALKLLKKPKLSGGGSTTTGNNNNTKSAGQLHGQISDNKINGLFETYRDEESENAILAPGIERLCCDLRYKPEDFAVLVLAWRLDASQMCRFTKTEFIQGLHTLNADSIESIRQRLEEEVVRLAGDAELFKNLYRFTFRFGLEPELRTLPLDMAISLWRLVFTVHTPDILHKWLDYLAENPQQIRGIPKDTWNMFLNFAETCDIYSYSDEDAWPSVFDDFVEYENERRNREKEQEVVQSGT